MAEFQPREFFYHSCEARRSTSERLNTPLHYHLKRGDIMAFRRELRAGTNPLSGDAHNRTPLEVLITIVEDLLITAFCTSYPVDDLINTLRTETIFPAKFALPDWKENMNGLYTEQEHQLYLALQKSNPQKPGTHHRLLRRNEELIIPGVKKPVFPKYPVSHNALPSHSFNFVHNEEDPAKAYEQSVLIAAEDHLNKPVSHTIAVRLEQMARKVRVYLDLMIEVCSCDVLVGAVLQRREEGNVVLEGSIWLKDLTLPYLYITTIQLLLELYSKAPDDIRWNPKSPTDCRTLVGIICKFNLTGTEILLFLSEMCDMLTDFLLTLPGPSFRPSSQTCAYFLHMSFVLDCPRLFQLLVTLLPTECIKKSTFDWNSAFHEITTCPFLSHHMEGYLAGLHTLLHRDQNKQIPGGESYQDEDVNDDVSNDVNEDVTQSSSSLSEQILVEVRPRRSSSKKKENKKRSSQNRNI